MGGRIGRFNGPTPEPNVIGLVKFHPLFIRRVNEFDQVGSVRLDGLADMCTTLIYVCIYICTIMGFSVIGSIKFNWVTCGVVGPKNI